MINIKDKLIISIVNEKYENIIELAHKYSKIELRLAQLSLTNQEIINIINASELVVITDIAELKDNNDFHKINLNNVIEKIIIDCPVDKIENKNLLKYINKPYVKKIFSYHNNAFSYSIFSYILEKIKTQFNKNDIIKIAVEVKNIDDICDLLDFLYQNFDYNLILVPLGKEFQQWRKKSLQLGSKYMFCYINNPACDCQLHYEEY